VHEPSEIFYLSSTTRQFSDAWSGRSGRLPAGLVAGAGSTVVVLDGDSSSHLRSDLQVLGRAARDGGTSYFSVTARIDLSGGSR